MDKVGTLYGVGVGPGDPELITVKALRTMERCPVIAAPRTAGGRMLALEIAARAVDLSGKTILPLTFTMARREEDRRAAHEQAAAAIEAHLASGRDAAFLTLGDVSVYSTFGYVAARLRERGFETRRIPGVPSFCAAAARLDWDLGLGREPIHILPGGREGLSLPGTKVLLKAGDLSGLAAELAARDVLEKAAAVRDCGLPGERVIRDLSKPPEATGYFTTIIVKE